MNTPIRDLTEEHGGILLMLTVMEKISAKLKRGEEIEKKHLVQIVEFLKNFADLCHHGKEEGILFPQLEKLKINNIVINKLLGEHKTGRDLIRGISESVSDFAAGNPEAFHIAENIDGYILLLRKHIRDENMLFDQAGRLIPETIQQDISKQFEKLERDVIGEGKHEVYHSWLNALRQEYLN